MGTQPRSDNPAASRQQPLSNGSTPCRLCVSSWVGTFVTLFSGVFNRLRQRPRSPAPPPSTPPPPPPAPPVSSTTRSPAIQTVNAAVFPRQIGAGSWVGNAVAALLLAL